MNKYLLFLLVFFGADVAAANLDGTRPLHYFARQPVFQDKLPEYKECLQCLLRSGIDINQPNRNGETALHLSVVHSTFPVFQMFIDHGADIYAKNEYAYSDHNYAMLSIQRVCCLTLYYFDRYGETVLHYGIMAQKKEVVEKVLDMGMDPRQENGPKGMAPLQMAARMGIKAKDIYNILRGKNSD